MAQLEILVLLVTIDYTFSASYVEYEEFVHKQSLNATFVKQFEEHVQLFKDNLKGLNRKSHFHCKTLIQDGFNPSSVHEIQPKDVKVIAAMGDSITAGTGITAIRILDLLIQNRGLSWSVGGDKSIEIDETLPNIIKVYNPNLQGFSIGSGPVEWKSVSHLNVAKPGSKSIHMVDQAKMLVERMKDNSAINFKEDWKIITLFVGANDLCQFCTNKMEFAAEKYIANIQNALDYLHANVPRAFVNLVEVLNVSMVKRLNVGFICSMLHVYLCQCASLPESPETKAELLAQIQRYRELTNQLVNSNRYDTRDDFTVVVQPFFRDSEPPKMDHSDNPDMSYFAPDCFHLSLKGHSIAANSLWNNMLEPVGKKSTKWRFSEEVTCPSDTNPYLYTYKNSKKSVNISASMHDETETNSGTYFETKASQHEQSGKRFISKATTVIITVLVIGTVVLLFSVLFIRKKVKNGERTLLLNGTDNKQYTFI